MRISKLLALPLLLTTSFSLALHAQRFQTEQFWMSGIPITWMNKQLHLPPNDFMDVFKPDAPWQQGESKVSVFKIPAQFILFGSDEQIRTAFNAMHQRHIKMAIEMGSAVKLEACGGGEGYAPPTLADKIGSRVQGLGLTLDIIAFDEPVWFAHEKTWGNAAGAPNCAYPLPKVAHIVGITMTTMRKYFPQIEYGDIEPITPDRTPAPQLIADYVQFAHLMQQETGKKMSFFHADIAVNSKGPWLPVVAILKREMHQNGIPVGAVIGGDLDDKTAPAWTQHGLNILRTLNQSPATSLDQVIIQSWQPLPTQMLPETEPGTETFLLLRSEEMMSHQPPTGRPLPPPNRP